MAPNTILIVGGGVRPQEPVANEAITPGQLVEYVQTGTHAGRIKKHASAGGPATKMFALEADYIGNPIGTDYASGDRVHALIAERGARIYAWLASGENVNLGAKLMSDGSGDLKAWATTNTQPDTIVGVAGEAVDASSARTRITVEVI